MTTEFEEENNSAAQILKDSPFKSDVDESKMVQWLISQGFVRNEKQSRNMLLTLSIIIITLALYIFLHNVMGVQFFPSKTFDHQELRDRRQVHAPSQSIVR